MEEIRQSIAFFQLAPLDVLETLCSSYHREQPAFAATLLPLHKMEVTKEQIELLTLAVLEVYHAYKGKNKGVLPELTENDIRTNIVSLAMDFKMLQKNDDASNVQRHLLQGEALLSFCFAQLSKVFPDIKQIHTEVFIIWFGLFRAMETTFEFQGTQSF